MRGKYRMMDWEVLKWTQVVSAAIHKMTQNQSYQEDFTNEDVCPANISTVLENLGWEHYDSDENGWENDTWWYYRHDDYDFHLVMYYEGYTFTFQLNRTDWED